jgi:hypothetical protein
MAAGEWEIVLRVEWDWQVEPFNETLRFKWQPGSDPEEA